MPDDVYQPPRSKLTREPDAPLLAGPAEFSIGTALGDGWRAMVASFPLWLGIGVMGFALAIASVITVIGIVLLIPVLNWGFCVAALRMFDGRGRFADLFAGFSTYGRALGYGLGLLALFCLASAPGTIAQLVVQQDETMSSILLGAALGIAWSFVTIRFMPAWFFLVEHDKGPLQSMRASWIYTRGQWGRLILYALAGFGILGIPLGGLVLYMLLPIGGLGILIVVALWIGIIPASAVIGFGYISIYRQITQTRVEPA